MKVLFLDIDGVLNSFRSVHALNGYPHSYEGKCMGKFDVIALNLIRKLCEETDCSIVLSSSWRIGKKPFDAAQGLDLPIFDHTPYFNDSDKKRGHEIKAWLDKHPEVTVYAIVDDDSDMLEEQKKNFVKTKHSDGLLWKDYVKLKNILGVVQSQKAK